MKKVVTIRVFRGSELNYDEKGKAKNENHLVKLSDGLPLEKYLGLIKSQSFCKVETVSVMEEKKRAKNSSKKVLDEALSAGGIVTDNFIYTHASEKEFKVVAKRVHDAFYGDKEEKTSPMEQLTKRIEAIEEAHSAETAGLYDKLEQLKAENEQLKAGNPETKENENPDQE